MQPFIELCLFIMFVFLLCTISYWVFNFITSLSIRSVCCDEQMQEPIKLCYNI